MLRRASISIAPPKITITTPHHRLMFTPTTCTRSTAPSIARIAPQMAKSSPMGTRRSNVISPENEIERDHEREDNSAQEHRPLPPCQARVARPRREAVDEPLQVRLGLRGGCQA